MNKTIEKAMSWFFDESWAFWILMGIGMITFGFSVNHCNIEIGRMEEIERIVSMPTKANIYEGKEGKENTKTFFTLLKKITKDGDVYSYINSESINHGIDWDALSEFDREIYIDAMVLNERGIEDAYPSRRFTQEQKLEFWKKKGMTLE